MQNSKGPVHLKATMKTRVPSSQWHAQYSSSELSWLVGVVMDGASELLLQFDGAIGPFVRLEDLRLTGGLDAGDYVVIESEMVRWGDQDRVIACTVRRTIARLPQEAAGISMVAQVLPHPVTVATCRVVATAPDVPTKGQGEPDPLVICVAPTGHELTKQDHPNVPTSPEEIAAEVARCAVEGATVVHLHVRDEQGKPTHDPKVFAEAVRQIRQRCDVIIQASTEGDSNSDVETRCAGLRIPGVDMGTVATGTVNQHDHIYFNSRPIMERVGQIIEEYDLAAAVEVMDLGFIENAKTMARKGLLKLPTHFTLIMGSRGGIGARSSFLEIAVEQIPRGSTWSVAGIGRHQLPMAEQALALGGHVRVGFENGLILSGGTKAQGNAALVAAVADMARKRNRKIATVPEARRILGVQQNR